MKKITIFIVLRILSFIVFGFYVLYLYKLVEFSSLFDNDKITLDEYNELNSGIRIYFYILPIFWVIDGFFNLSNKKQRLDRKISLKEYLLPEFNHSDEREAALTGKAARAGLATITVYTILVLISYIVILTSEITVTTFMIFGTISIPVVGFISYYGTYRYYYLK